MTERDWVFELKSRIKKNRRLATAVFYLTDLAYLNMGQRRRFMKSFPGGARLLNLGAGFRASPPGFRGVDREAYPGIDVVADLTALPFADGSVDGVLCEMVLEHVPDARTALQEMKRVLKPAGQLYLAVPFLWPYHASPHDYWRWTVSGLEREMDGLETVRIGLAGGPTTTLCNVLHEWLALVLSFNVDLVYRLAYLTLIPVISPFKLLDRLLSHYRHAGKIGALYYLHGRKAAPGPR